MWSFKVYSRIIQHGGQLYYVQNYNQVCQHMLAPVVMGSMHDVQLEWCEINNSAHFKNLVIW